MNKINLNILIILVVTLPLHAQDATEIVRKADQLMRGESSYMEMKMTIIRPDWQREMTLKGWSKGRDRSLMVITAPARDKGTTFLMRDKEIWNWVPSIERTIKIPPSMMMQSWMGSDFTNDDLIKESSIVEDYHHTLLGTETIRGYDCYKIEMTPKPEAAVVWGKIRIWIAKETYFQVQVEYYDEDGYLVQTMNLSEFKKMDDRTIPTRLEMIPADPDKAGHKTVVEYLEADFNIDIDDTFFSQQNMKRVR
ncbi:MAG: outer membrane lipoprotein-sorting protein [Gemmatimonadetes bacterium]|nr:MAG: outer membrane lipoprotein-sorting protein [Gemmatimonadota bacterium]